MARTHRFHSIPFLLLLVGGAAGCENRTVTALEVAQVTVTPDAGDLQPGQTLQLSATALDPAGSPLERAVQWRSDDESVATVDPQGLVEAHGAGVATVTASTGSANGSASITVSQPARIASSAASVSFEATHGDETAGTREIAISNAGGGSIGSLTASVAYEASEGWLEVTLARDAAPTTATLRASARGLPAGTHRASVSVASPDADNSPFGIDVEIRVREAPPSIQLSPSAVGFVWEEGRQPPPPQRVTVTNAGGGELSGLTLSVRYAEGQPSGWLDAELDRSGAPAELTLRVSPGSLGPGGYEAFVRVSGGGGAGAAEVRVHLAVAEPPTPRVVVSDVSYSRSGLLWRHLQITVRIQDEEGNPVPFAEVFVSIHHTGREEAWNRNGVTGTNGSVTFTLWNYYTGCYEVEVTDVMASGFAWDGVTPSNSHCSNGFSGEQGAGP